MVPSELVIKHLTDSAALKICLAKSESAQVIADAARKLADRVARGGKIMLCGNGGSAADSQHIAAELTNRLRPTMERPAIPAIALTTDTSFLTARANDYGFDDVFERLIEALGRSDDALIAISTSGASRNVVRAVSKSRMMGLLTVGMLGSQGSPLAGMVDVAIFVPSDSTQHIQECHGTIGHILCELIEEMLYGTMR